MRWVLDLYVYMPINIKTLPKGWIKFLLAALLIIPQTISNTPHNLLPPASLSE